MPYSFVARRASKTVLQLCIHMSKGPVRPVSLDLISMLGTCQFYADVFGPFGEPPESLEGIPVLRLKLCLIDALSSKSLHHQSLSSGKIVLLKASTTKAMSRKGG